MSHEVLLFVFIHSFIQEKFNNPLSKVQKTRISPEGGIAHYTHVLEKQSPKDQEFKANFDSKQANETRTLGRRPTS